MRGETLSNSEKIRDVHNSFARYIFIFVFHNEIIGS
jgi:hypothetical protein